MAKITTKVFAIAGRKCEYGIYYSESNKFFIKNFDENIGGLYTSEKYGCCETFDELIKKAEDAIKAYEEKIAELRKVIILSLTGAKSHLEKYRCKDRNYNESKFSPEWLSDLHATVFDGGIMGFHIEFQVKMFRKTGDQHEFYDIGGNGKLINKHIISNLTMYQIIDWTQEKEDAFKKLHDMFDALLDKFVTAMGKPDQFIEAIQSQKLLPNK